VNVLLALLSGSVLTGVAAFFFSTVVITIVGEIIPQAYFTRHAMVVASTLVPLLRIYQYLLFPVAKPTAWVLDHLLGKEAIGYLQERDLQELIKLHMQSAETEIDRMEGRGAINFLALDDLPLAEEGEPVDPESVIQVRFASGRPVFPEISASHSDPFLQLVQRSGKKWVIMVDEQQYPRMVLNADKMVRDALFNQIHFNPYQHCHRPIVVEDGLVPLGKVIPRFQVNPAHSGDDVIDEDIILLWGEQRKVITGSDILGRLLRGIVHNEAITLEKVQG